MARPRPLTLPRPPKVRRSRPPKVDRPRPPRLSAPKPPRAIPERTAGRPRVIGDAARVSVSLGPEDVAWLDAWAARHRPPITSRSEAIRRVIAALRGRARPGP